MHSTDFNSFFLKGLTRIESSQDLKWALSSVPEVVFIWSGKAVLNNTFIVLTFPRGLSIKSLSKILRHTIQV